MEKKMRVNKRIDLIEEDIKDSFDNVGSDITNLMKKIESINEDFCRFKNFIETNGLASSVARLQEEVLDDSRNSVEFSLSEFYDFVKPTLKGKIQHY